MWSSIVKKDPPSKPCTSDGAILGLVGECKSTKGISIAVVDANAVIEGRHNLTTLAEKLVTVPQVLSEIRDPASCRRLPFSMQIMEPSPKSLRKVIEFARATGDLQALSHVDIKLIALTYTLEAQIHGTKYLRELPPPIQIVRLRRLADKDLPGWGSNVANLEEWEALENETEENSNSTSKIFPLKDLNINILPSDNSPAAPQEAEHEGERKQRRYPPKKTEVKLAGKMVVEGIDASQGEYDDGDWRPAVSSTTHRKFLRRKATRELKEQEFQRDLEADKAGNLTQDTTHQMPVKDERPETNAESDGFVVEAEGIDDAGDTFEPSFMTDDGSSEQSWLLRALSESSVACVTADYAMQNVILQMGLRLLAPVGMQIRQLNRWIWNCHACHKGTAQHPCTILVFCPNCGNCGTLYRLPVTIDENGPTISMRKPHFLLRGTKFPISMPRGGRDAITKNLVLREDQRPLKYLHPKTKKKASKAGDEYFISDNVFMNSHSDRKAPLQPPVRKTMAIFSQKRNPNDNHYSRSMH